jgi:TonB family protein
LKYWWFIWVIAGCAPGGGASRSADHPTELGTTGHLPAARIKGVVQSHFGIFRTCYARSHNPKVKGTVSVRFVIDRDGRVSLSELDESTLDDDVTNCVVDGFRKLKFPRPEGGVVTVVYPINFSPG